VEEAVEEVRITLELSTRPVRARPALSVSRLGINNFSAGDQPSFSGAYEINRQIHNPYYYCYSLLEI